MSISRAFFTRWLLAILWMGLIFTGSSDVGAGAHTSRFIVPFLHCLMGGSFTPERAESIHLLIRKTGHLTEYAVLCILYWRALGTLREDFFQSASRRFLSTVFLTALYAGSDEFHQSFIPSRTASFSDVLIDTTGATLGLCFYLIIRGYFHRRTLRPHLDKS